MSILVKSTVQLEFLLKQDQDITFLKQEKYIHQRIQFLIVVRYS